MFHEMILLKWAHILAMVYWLGGEWGVFQTSYNVVNRKLALDERLVISTSQPSGVSRTSSTVAAWRRGAGVSSGWSSWLARGMKQVGKSG